MTRTHKIIYWVTTIWLVIGMTSTGIVQLLKMEGEVTNFQQLGYPLYLLSILGIAKLLGVVVVLVPKLPTLKEWAYAGFFFAMAGAIISHLVSGHWGIELFGPSLLLLLTILSWYFRPAIRRS